MKRYIIFLILVLFLFINQSFAINDIKVYTLGLWFPGYGGSSWTYQTSDGNLVTAVKVYQEREDAEEDVYSSNYNFDFDRRQNEMLSLIKGIKAFDRFCPGEEIAGPFCTYSVFCGVDGYVRPFVQVGVRDFLKEKFLKKEGTKTGFFSRERGDLTGWYVPDIKKSTSWKIVPEGITIQVGYGPSFWDLATYSYSGNIVWTNSGGTFSRPYVVEVHYRAGIEIEPSEEFRNTYPEVYRIEFGFYVIECEGEWFDDEWHFEDWRSIEETQDSVWWCVPDVGPVKFKDSTTGIEMVLKNYKRVPYPWEKPKGQSVDSFSKLVTTWGAIKK